jgi:hypothetical protein
VDFNHKGIIMATTFMKDGKMFRLKPNTKQGGADMLEFSRDKGLNWSHVRYMPWKIQDFMVDGNDIIATTTDGKIQISHDDGVNWIPR